MAVYEDDSPRPRVLLAGAVVLCLVVGLAGLLAAFAAGAVEVPLDFGAWLVREAVQFLVGVVVAAAALAVVLAVTGGLDRWVCTRGDEAESEDPDENED